MNAIKKVVVASSLLAAGLYSSALLAQEPAIACPGYKAPKTQLIGERTGKKLTAAFEAYNEDRVADAIEVLRDIEAKDPFDRATVDRFLGQLLVSQDDKEAEAFDLLVRAAKPGVLNDKDQAGLLRLNGDLSLSLEKYEDALGWYNQWMEFTCKEEEQVYTRMAQAYNELKQYENVIEPADKAIALMEKPNKNPYVLKLNAFIETKQFDKAVDVAETLVLTFPTEKLWWSQLGMMYMMVEDYPTALATFSVAYKNGYLSKTAEYKVLWQLYAQLEAPIKAAKLFKQFLDEGKLETTATELAALANVYHQAKEFEEAAKYYARAAAEKPDPDYFKKQGNLLISAEDYKGAIEALNNALDANVDDPERVHFSLMQANYYAGNYRKAYEHAGEARKDNSLRRNANAWMSVIKNKAKNRGITI